MSTPDTAVQNALNLARKKKFPAARRLLFDAMENPALALRAQELLVAMLAKGNGRAAREAPRHRLPRLPRADRAHRQGHPVSAAHRHRATWLKCCRAEVGRRLWPTFRAR